jgi:hypothetical protein
MRAFSPLSPGASTGKSCDMISAAFTIKTLC